MAHDEHEDVHELDVRVLVVSSTRDEDSDTGGALAVQLIAEEGHTVVRDFVDDDIAAIQERLVEYANSGADAAILTGGTGISRRDVTPEACEALFDRHIPGFGELFRVLSLQEIGSAAMLSRATAGLIGPMAVFAIPGSEDAVETAVGTLILPELGHVAGEIAKEGAPSVDLPQQTEEIEPEWEDDEEDEDEDTGDEDTPERPPPSGKLGRLGQGSVQLNAVEPDSPAAPAEDDDFPAQGWKRAVYEVEATVAVGEWTDIPEELERISPVVDVLHQAGERGIMTVGDRQYVLFGYPDLQRPTSRVLAVAEGDPIAEVIALHRYPVMTGILIDTSEGLLPHRTRYSVEGLCDAITGRTPKDSDGEVYAIQGDTVWIQRGSKVIRWDGRREFDDGSPKQVMATLMLHWSNR